MANACLTDRSKFGEASRSFKSAVWEHFEDSAFNTMMMVRRVHSLTLLCHGWLLEWTLLTSPGHIQGGARTVNSLPKTQQSPAAANNNNVTNKNKQKETERKGTWRVQISPKAKCPISQVSPVGQIGSKIEWVIPWHAALFHQVSWNSRV